MVTAILSVITIKTDYEYVIMKEVIEKNYIEDNQSTKQLELIAFTFAELKNESNYNVNIIKIVDFTFNN